MVEELAEIDTTADPAVKAFEALRGEVALLRMAMEGFAAEHRSIQIPDYSESIGQLTRKADAIGRKLVALSELPAFALPPEGFSRQIIAASETVRAHDRETTLPGRDALRASISELTRSLLSAREANKQNIWLIWSASASALAGVLIWVFVFGPLLHRLGLAFG